MITAQMVKDFNPRLKAESVAQLANDIKASAVSIRSQDPIQAWEAHPVVSSALDSMDDRSIAAAIDFANGDF